MIRLGLLLLFLAQILPGADASAHEVRPGLLQLRETESERFEYSWRAPVRYGRALKMAPVFPEQCQVFGSTPLRPAGAFATSEGELVCQGGLLDAAIRIDGLETLRTDVLVRVAYLNGGEETLRATPDAPTVYVTGSRGILDVSAAYFALGVEHILLGVDHLLFVAALLMLVDGWRRLVATVTAFTVAHSITLAGATLGVLSAPTALIEALIALSIVFVAAEVIQKRRGDDTLAIRRPWLIAFAFGLLHGFGFAGALSDVGLPENAVPAALLFFNVGVEAGQLLFIAAAMSLAFVAKRFLRVRSSAWPVGFATLIGVMAGFWTVERVVAIWA